LPTVRPIPVAWALANAVRYLVKTRDPRDMGVVEIDEFGDEV